MEQATVVLPLWIRQNSVKSQAREAEVFLLSSDLFPKIMNWRHKLDEKVAKHPMVVVENAIPFPLPLALPSSAPAFLALLI